MCIERERDGRGVWREGGNGCVESKREGEGCRKREVGKGFVEREGERKGGRGVERKREGGREGVGLWSEKGREVAVCVERERDRRGVE